MTPRPAHLSSVPTTPTLLLATFLLGSLTLIWFCLVSLSLKSWSIIILLSSASPRCPPPLLSHTHEIPELPVLPPVLTSLLDPLDITLVILELAGLADTRGSIRCNGSN